MNTKGFAAIAAPMLCCVSMPALAHGIAADQTAPTQPSASPSGQVENPSSAASDPAQAATSQVAGPDPAQSSPKAANPDLTAATASASASGDEAQPDIIVSGTRQRLSPSPQSEKKSSISFVSTVGTEELVKRADTTVVAALERLPGVVRQRGTFTSQAAYPAIRGFNGWYNSVTLDGGVLYTSTRNQRGTTLDFLPVAAINELVVSKTVTPDMDPNSIGGHIDIRTLRSFDNDGQPLTMLNGEGTFYSKPGALHNANPSYLINGAIKRTFGPGGNFGFVLAGSTHKDAYNETYNTTTTFVQTSGVDVASGNLQRGNYDSRSHGFSLMGKLEARGEKFYGFVAGNYFQDSITRNLYRSIVSIAPGLVTNAGEGTGTFTGASPQALSNLYLLDRRVYAIRGGLEYQTNENSKIVANASYLNSDFGEELWTGGTFRGPTATGSYNIDNKTPAVALSGPSSLSDPTQWTQAAGTVASQTKYPLPTDIITARLEYRSNNFDFSRGFGYDFGIDFRQMWRQLNQFDVRYTLPAGTTLNLGQVLSPGATFTGADPSQAIYVDRDRYWNLVGALGAQTIVPNPTANYKLNENVTAPFAAVYYTTDKFRVLAGVRYNITHYTDSASTIVSGLVTPFSITRTLPYLLPNVQGYYNFTEKLRVRAAFTETTALQNYNDFAQGITTNYDNKGNIFIQGSNPYLKPRKSYNEDLSLEYYASHGYFAFGYFHKTIVNEVQGVTSFQYDGTGNVISTTSTPVNGGGEHTQGLELEAEWRDFTGISPWLQGLNLAINGAVFDSDTNFLVGNNVSRRLNYLRQQPKWVTNVILTYNSGPFSASAIAQSRGRALSGFNVNPALDTYIAPFTTLDLKIGYRISRYFNLYAEGRNVTNYTYKEVFGLNKNLVSTAIVSGPVYVVGARLNF